MTHNSFISSFKNQTEQIAYKKKKCLIWGHGISSWRKICFLGDERTLMELFCLLCFLSSCPVSEGFLHSISQHLNLNSFIYSMVNIGDLPKGFLTCCCSVTDKSQVKKGPQVTLNLKHIWISLGPLKIMLQYCVRTE